MLFLLGFRFIFGPYKLKIYLLIRVSILLEKKPSKMIFFIPNLKVLFYLVLATRVCLCTAFRPCFLHDRKNTLNKLVSLKRHLMLAQINLSQNILNF